MVCPQPKPASVGRPEFSDLLRVVLLDAVHSVGLVVIRPRIHQPTTLAQSLLPRQAVVALLGVVRPRSAIAAVPKTHQGLSTSP